MLSEMYDSDKIPEEFRDLAKSTISLELEYDYDGTDELNIDDQIVDQNLLQAIVNEELAKLNQDEIDALVVATQEKYPYWTPENDLDAILGLQTGLDETIASFDSDGTFWSSLKTRFKSLDYVWLLLGLVSAFVIAKLLGEKEATDEDLNPAHA